MATRDQDALGQKAVMAFPLSGVDAEQPFDLQPPGTTPTAVNVCSVDPSTNRARGGSRPGLGRFLPPLATLGEIQELEIIVDPQADALTADFGELPIGDLIQFEWIDDPTLGLNRYGMIRNQGQVRKGGSGRETGFNSRGLSLSKTPTMISWSDPADMTAGDALGGSQLNAVAVEAPAGILAIAGTMEYSPAAGTILSVGRATLNVKFTPTDEGVYKGCVGRAAVNVTKATPTITWSNPANITVGTLLSTTQLNAIAKHPVTLAVIAGTYTYTPPSGTQLAQGNNQVLSVQFVPTNTAAYDTPADKTVLINVIADSGGDIIVDDVYGVFVADTTGSGAATTVTTTTFTIGAPAPGGTPHGAVEAIADPSSGNWPGDADIGTPMFLYRTAGVWYYIWTP